jgi:alkylhydroperoxidase family enzyme
MARISPLPPKEWPPEMREAFAALRPPHTTQLALRTEGRPRALNALGTLAHHPELARAFNTFNGHILYTSTLSARQRELLVLRVASLRSSEYEWAQHIVLAADVGLTDDEIGRIAQGSEAPGWPPLDRAMLAAAEELVGEGMVSDPTWQTLAAQLDDRQLMDLVFTVGTYEILAMAFRSFGVELDDDLLRK